LGLVITTILYSLTLLLFQLGTMGCSIWLFQIRNTPEFKEEQRKLTQKSEFSLLNPIFKK